MEINWKDGFKISVKCDGGAITLSANKEGMLSLANHLIALAGESPGAHVHYDENNSLEENSMELIIEKIN